jgi:deazaflavin-dependent oxidoreductase (nitroreductase family)
MADKGFWGKLTSRTGPPKPGTPLWKGFQAVTKLNVWAYRASRGRIGGRFDAAPVCILHHRGAKSGQKRETPLVYLRDGDRVVLVASMGGMPKNPAWYHNLRADPDVEIERDGRREPMTARVTDGDERTELWQKVLTVWPTYDDYQARTSRRIPVIVCEPRST